MTVCIFIPQALDELNGINIEGECVDISLAKPVDKKRQEKQRERKMYGGGNNWK